MTCAHPNTLHPLTSLPVNHALRGFRTASLTLRAGAADVMYVHLSSLHLLIRPHVSHALGVSRTARRILLLDAAAVIYVNLDFFRHSISQHVMHALESRTAPSILLAGALAVMNVILSTLLLLISLRVTHALIKLHIAPCMLGRVALRVARAPIIMKSLTMSAKLVRPPSPCGTLIHELANHVFLFQTARRCRLTAHLAPFAKIIMRFLGPDAKLVPSGIL